MIINYFTIFFFAITLTWQTTSNNLSLAQRPTIFSSPTTLCHIKIIERNSENFHDIRLFRNQLGDGICCLQPAHNKREILQPKD